MKKVLEGIYHYLNSGSTNCAERVNEDEEGPLECFRAVGGGHSGDDVG